MSRAVRSCVAALLLVAACCADTRSTHYDTIVVGLGAAGTAAASELARAGRRVLALEAQGRAGGRVWTRHFGDGIIEFGAEWIHGTTPSRVFDLAVAHNVTTSEQELVPVFLRAGGERPAPELLDLVSAATELAFKEGEKVEPAGDVATRRILAYVNEKYPAVSNDSALVTEVLYVTQLLVNSYEGSDDWRQVDAAPQYVPLGGHQHASWGRNGYRTLFDILLNKFNNGSGLPTLDIKLNTEVTSISWSPEPRVVEVTAGGLNYTADNVIVTVSIGVLKERHASLFSPPLPAEKVTAIETTTMGTIGKIILSFEQAWWEEGEAFVFLWTAGEREAVPEERRWITKVPSATTPKGSSNTLTLWTSGDTTRLVENLPEEAVQSGAMEVLRRFMRVNGTIPEPTGMLRTSWFSNPFTRGTYTFDSVAMAALPTLHATLGAPLADSAGAPRVLFAGEATHPTQCATVHGAVDSGYREAMRVLGKLEH